MWTPRPLYEARPYLYVIAGVLLISGAMYIGIDTPDSLFYFVAGVLIVLGGLTIFVRRQAYRQKPRDGQPAEPA